jgi:hypothetical protein
MSQSAEEPQQGTSVKGPLIIPFTELSECFGLVPQEDPDTGMVFFLWDNMFPRTEDGIPLPNYTVQETAKFFFGRGSDWLRWRYRPANDYPDGYFVLNGTILTAKRTKTGNRYYTLADIERMAHALAQNHALDGEQLLVIIHLVLFQARVHGIVRNLSI